MVEQQGRGGDAAKREAKTLGRGGVFELLATVAGQILQGAGGEDGSRTNRGDREGAKGELEVGVDCVRASLESRKRSTSGGKPRSSGDGRAKGEGVAHVGWIGDVCGEGCNDVESTSGVVRTPSQEEERTSSVKDVAVDESNATAARMDASAMEDVVSMVIMLSVRGRGWLCRFGTLQPMCAGSGGCGRCVLMAELALWRRL